VRLILQVAQGKEKEMKTTLSIIGIVVLGFFLITVVGGSQAGEWMHRSSGEGKSMEQASGTPAPEIKPFETEYGEPVETGILPSREYSGEMVWVEQYDKDYGSMEFFWVEEYDRDYGSMEPFLLE
jgi:hypothetical protein